MAFDFELKSFDFAFRFKEVTNRGKPKLTPILTFGYSKIIWDHWVFCNPSSSRIFSWCSVIVAVGICTGSWSFSMLTWTTEMPASSIHSWFVDILGALELPCSVWRHFKDWLLMSTRDFSDFYLGKKLPDLLRNCETMWSGGIGWRRYLIKCALQPSPCWFWNFLTKSPQRITALVGVIYPSWRPCLYTAYRSACSPMWNDRIRCLRVPTLCELQPQQLH